MMVKHWVLSRAVGMYLVTNFGESSEGKKERERRKEQAAAELVMLENNLDAAMREGKLAEVLELRTAILRAKVKLGKASFPLLNVRSAGRHRLKKTELMDAGEAHATAFELSQVAWRELVRFAPPAFVCYSHIRPQQLHEQPYLPATSAVPPKVSNIDILETFDRQRRDLHHLDRNTAMEFLVVMQVGIYSVGESDIFLLDSYPTTHNIWANVPFPACDLSLPTSCLC